MSNTNKYNFIQLNKNNEYRYYSTQKIDKYKQKCFYQSYSSEIEDANKRTIEQLKRHKETIDFAIKYVENQVSRGLKYGQIVYPNSLHKNYRWYVLKFVETKLHLTKSKEETKGSQKYWISGGNIKTYGFRDKTRQSKFQCFVEFISAYKEESTTIKLNLRMSKKAYDNRHLFYLDGFDLVFKQDSIYVRHISEKLVKNKEDNGIVKYMSIDSWSNIHSIIVNSSIDTTFIKKQYKLQENESFLYGITHNTCNKKGLKRALTRVKSMESKETFFEDIQKIKNAIHSKVCSIVNKHNECKIIICIPDGIQSKLCSIIQQKFIESIKNECSKYGIKLEIQYEHIDEIKKRVLSYRQKSNDVALGFKPYREKQLKSHLKWSEIAISAILKNYENTYIALYSNSKSTRELGKSTEQSDTQVLSQDKPVYPSFSVVKRLFTIDGECDVVNARIAWLSQIKHIANEYYKTWLAEHSNVESSQNEELDDIEDIVFV